MEWNVFIQSDYCIKNSTVCIARVGGWVVLGCSVLFASASNRLSQGTN